MGKILDLSPETEIRKIWTDKALKSGNQPSRAAKTTTRKTPRTNPEWRSHKNDDRGDVVDDGTVLDRLENAEGDTDQIGKNEGDHAEENRNGEASFHHVPDRFGVAGRLAEVTLKDAAELGLKKDRQIRQGRIEFLTGVSFLPAAQLLLRRHDTGLPATRVDAVSGNDFGLVHSDPANRYDVGGAGNLPPPSPSLRAETQPANG